MKFPKIPHLPWSPGIKADDISCSENDVRLLRENTPLMYSEKLDGECTFLSAKSIHARSEDSGYQKPWQTFIKRHWAVNVCYHIPDDIGIFCESLYAIHTIEYYPLPDYLFVFGAVDLRSKMYLSLMDTADLARRLKLKMVPMLFQSGLQARPLPYTSRFGPECEGYVVRTMQAFPMDQFPGHIAKFVRKDHVKSDEHWTKNWRKAALAKPNEGRGK